MSQPFLSAFCICGDSGVKTLGRALRSLVVRSSGEPLVDEVVIGWNGKDEKALSEALETSGLRDCFALPHTIVRFDWPGRFDTARNTTMAKCRGEWILWFDSDDVLSDAGDTEGPDGLKAIIAVEKAYGLYQPPEGAPSAKGTTLREWFQKVPYNVNCITAPYDYAILQDGSVTIRQPVVRRILRRSSNWIWRSFSGVHEIPYPAQSIGEASLYTSGLLIRHYPPAEAQDRLKRNAQLVAKMEAPEIKKHADARHYYDLAGVHIGTANFPSAIEAIDVAIKMARNDEDLFRYLIIRASLLGTVSRFAEAITDSLKAISVYPDQQEGYFCASEMYYLIGRPQACVKYYELGMACKVRPTALDLCVNRVVRPRANAAVSYCQLGDPEKALAVAKEAVAEYPNDELAKRAYERCLEDLTRKKAMEGLLDSIEYLIRKREVPQAKRLMASLTTAVSFRAADIGARARMLSAMLEKIVLPEVLQDGQHWIYPAGGEPVDALSFMAAHPGAQVIDLQPEKDGSIRVHAQLSTREPVAFYVPGNGFMWRPTDPEQRGLGGSESSFIFVARELAKRGHPVTMYCYDDMNNAVDKGVLWRGLPSFDAGAGHGTLIACRTPYLARDIQVKVPTWCWHQDNGYANEFSWSPPVWERLAGSLHVSKWAMAQLVRELNGGSPPADDCPYWKKQHVIGNPVLPEWIYALRKKTQGNHLPQRSPHRVIYASDPMRGLDTLVNIWPELKDKHPDAELLVFSDFALTEALCGIGTPNESPNVVAIIEGLKHKLRVLPGIIWHGRVGQPQLVEHLMTASVYAYPGGGMVEGFGVSLVQATAAGCQVLAPNEGALLEVLSGAALVPAVRNDEDVNRFRQVLLDLLDSPMEEAQRLEMSEQMWARHGVEAVTDRFETAVGWR